MDWQLAINRNREALLLIVVALMKSLGLVDGGTLTTLSYCLYRKALLTLRQAESAMRRILVMAAHELSLRGYKPRKLRVSTTNFSLLNPRSEMQIPTFNLIDPLKIFGHDVPDFNASSHSYDENSSTVNNDPVHVASLARRLLALKYALDTIPKQAKRLARWYAQRDLALRQNQPHRLSPMRPGPPPALSRAKLSDVGTILTECHSLAIYARDRRDSS
jgi:hypothetical protein